MGLVVSIQKKRAAEVQNDEQTAGGEEGHKIVAAGACVKPNVSWCSNEGYSFATFCLGEDENKRRLLAVTNTNAPRGKPRALQSPSLAGKRSEVDCAGWVEGD